MATISITGLTRTSYSQERTSKLTLPIPDEWKHLNLKELRDELAGLVRVFLSTFAGPSWRDFPCEER
jgi:hypothetical protein